MSGTDRYLFICNPVANSGRLEKKWPTVQEEIEKFIAVDAYEVQFTTAPLEGTTLAKQAMQNDFTHIISVGGDGIANEVCNALVNADRDVIFGMIPAGTSNDAPLTHNLINDPVEAVAQIFESDHQKFGVGKVTGDFGDTPHYFLDHCDTGLAALAARSAKYGSTWLKGEWKYTYYALKNLLRFNKNPGIVTIDGEEYEGEFAVVAAGFGEHMSGYHLWPGNDNKAGDFGILLARGHSRFGLLKLMLAAEKGNHIGRDGVDYIRGKTLEIDLENPWPYQAEGEIFTEDSKKVTMEYIPAALSILSVEDDLP